MLRPRVGRRARRALAAALLRLLRRLRRRRPRGKYTYVGLSIIKVGIDIRRELSPFRCRRRRGRRRGRERAAGAVLDHLRVLERFADGLK